MQRARAANSERRSRRDGRTFLSTIVAAAMCVPMVLASRAGAARPEPAPSSPVPIQYPAVPCKQSELSGVLLIQMIHAIITHGDLTDIAFIEKTLGTKFTSEPYAVTPDGKPDRTALLYQAEQFLGAPIHIYLYVDSSKERQTKLDSIAELRIYEQGFGIKNVDFITRCLNISKYQFISSFGNDFMFSGNISDGPIENAGIEGATDLSARLGKNHSKLYLDFTDLTKSNLIFGIGIIERP